MTEPGGKSVIQRGLWFEEFEIGIGLIEGTEACGSEEDDGVLDALAAEARHGLVVLGENAEAAAVGAVEETGVFVGEGSLGEGWWQLIGHAESRFRQPRKSR